MSIMRGWKQTLVGVVIGLLAGVVVVSRLTVTAQAPPPFAAEVPTYRGLDSNLYMQTAAEYRACCLQAYNLATVRLKERHLNAKDQGKKLAVVMDLDETVLDNGGFYAMQLRSGLAFDLRLWTIWEEKHGEMVGLVPGAKEFILEAERLGVTMYYISNRDKIAHNSTLAILKRLGIGVKEPSQVKLRDTTSDKTKRREEVEKQHTVLLYVGDNLRDFDEQFRSEVDNTGDKKTTDSARLEKAIQQRKDRVDGTRPKWGTEWIILPNPSYGEWNKPLGLGRKDLDRLVPTIPKK